MLDDEENNQAMATTTVGDGVTEQSSTHMHQSKDGLYYATYQEMACANKRHNEAYLRDLGLERVMKVSPRKSPSVRSKKAQSKGNNAVRRSSRLRTVRKSSRIRKEPLPPESSGLSLDESDCSRSFKKKKSPVRRVQKQKKVQKATTTPLTKAQRAKLSKIPDWVEKMAHYLRQKEKLSDGNYRSVMRQVKKLATGEGITYHHWEEGVYFAKGEKIDLSWDLEELYIEAVEFENEHGQDLGNGWLLRHPISKMANFQAHRLK